MKKILLITVLILPTPAHAFDGLCQSQYRLAERVTQWKNTGMHFSAAYRLVSWRDIDFPGFHVERADIARGVVSDIYTGYTPSEIMNGCYEVFAR